ncbi:hypothetical protein J2747_001018 [Thermococcus stetteri]|nr:hypothetical protein [Thermococcus stetteri]
MLVQALAGRKYAFLTSRLVSKKYKHSKLSELKNGTLDREFCSK